MPGGFGEASRTAAGRPTYVTTWSYRVIHSDGDLRVVIRTYTGDTVPRELSLPPWTCEHRAAAAADDGRVGAGFSCRTPDAYADFWASCATTRVDQDIASGSLGDGKDPADSGFVIQCETHEVTARAGLAVEDAGFQPAPTPTQ
jgi:hypothetical protein